MIAIEIDHLMNQNQIVTVQLTVSSLPKSQVIQQLPLQGNGQRQCVLKMRMSYASELSQLNFIFKHSNMVCSDSMN